MNAVTMAHAPGAGRGTRRQAQARTARQARLLLTPAVSVLLVWMVVPLALTLWFSFQRYNLLRPAGGFAGFDNYSYLLGGHDLWRSIWNTVLLVGGVLAASIALGTLTAVLLDQPLFGRGILRLLCIAPFFVMPTVSALIWKNLLLNPVTGLFAWLAHLVHLTPVDWFSNVPLLAIGIIVAWQWIPFATLILLTALQSLDQDQMEAAHMDGAGPVARFRYITLPHLARPISIVVMIETIFLLSVFAEILVTTSGGPGSATTNLPYLVYKTALLRYDVGGASAGGIVAVVLANIVAFFLVRSVATSMGPRGLK
ncbi:carbohydrate ABC transporter permease [Lichenicoccus roseus]|nr:sugar ABC transporter permease [Lichenicoccus roseus]